MFNRVSIDLDGIQTTAGTDRSTSWAFVAVGWTTARIRTIGLSVHSLVRRATTLPLDWFNRSIEDHRSRTSPEEISGENGDRSSSCRSHNRCLQETLDELQAHRSLLDHLVQLNEQIQRGFTLETLPDADLHSQGQFLSSSSSSSSSLVHRRHSELWTKFHHLEGKLSHRREQLMLGNEHRQSFEQVSTRLTDWMKSNEQQQLRDPPINDLQETTSVLQEKHQLIQSLFGAAKDQLSEFADLTRLHAILSSNVNETDRLIVDERYSLLKDRYNRLLDTLTQRLTFLDQSIRQSLSLFSSLSLQSLV